jgi:dihydrofolate reductase
MRKLRISEFVSLDGVAEAPNEWNLPYVDETMGAAIERNTLEASALLFGRNTYETMAAAWPTRTGAIADAFNGLPKYVVTSSPKKLEWNGSERLEGDVVSAVRALKQKPGGEIQLWGSLALVDTLLRHALVDELLLYIHPLVLGKGRRLFTPALAATLQLVDTQTFNRGVVLLTYR